MRYAAIDLDLDAERHRWGPHPAPGGLRFRLWAPAARQVDLAKGWTRTLAMRSAADGWWEIETDQLRDGDDYAFVIDGRLRAPDPASRLQVFDVHGASRVAVSSEHRWRCKDWRGRPWEEAVIYELHVGAFTPAGTLDSAAERLDHLARMGVTAVELMPLAHFSGRFGWGYDGVLPYAPHRSYGGPDALRRFVDAAHERGIMVLLDVVYNHFGPEGNYIPSYAPQFFDSARRTPWGAAIDFTRPQVRQFFIQNAAYWIGEFRLDGLRLDAIDQMPGEAGLSLLEEIAVAARRAGAGRHVHLCTEDARNITRLQRRGPDGAPLACTAEWNDDFHHVAHVAATGETFGYYEDYVDAPSARLARILSSGYDYQGAPSAHRGAPRGEPSGHLPPTAFVNFLQNHDQVGNRALGERLGALAPPEAVEALTAILLLGPHVPLLFMGEEIDERRPFLFFADCQGDLAEAVRRGRAEEFRYWPALAEGASPPDPCSEGTMQACSIDWSRVEGSGATRLALVTRLLRLRRHLLAPRLKGVKDGAATVVADDGAVAVRWTLADGALYELRANIGDAPRPAPAAEGRPVFESSPGLAAALAAGEPLPAWSVLWTLRDAG